MLKSDPKSRLGLREIDELEDRIDKLKHSYDLFFSGIDNIDPSDKKAAIRGLISRLNEMRIANPRLRFRFQSLAGRFVSFNQYWTRTMREIENGTFKRDLFRSRIRKPDEAKAFFGKHAPDMDDGEVSDKHKAAAPQKADKLHRSDIRATEIKEEDLNKLNHKRPLAGPEGAKRRSYEATTRSSTSSSKQQPTAPAKSENTQLDNKKMDRIYREFVAERRKNNEPVERIKRKTVETQINMQASRIKEKVGAKEVDFKVIRKNGKVVLRPVVKK